MKREYKKPTIITTIFSFESIMENMRGSIPEDERSESGKDNDDDDFDW